MATSREKALSQPMNEHPNIIPVDTTNEHVIFTGENMSNHSATLAGFGKFIKVGAQHPQGLMFRTRQSVYRFCAYALIMAEAHGLPDEGGEHSFEEVLEAIQEV